jgi:hypothetical protein
VTTDASEYACGATLTQGTGPEQRIIAFASKKFSPAEQRYATHDQELLAIIFALKFWRHYLLGRAVSVYTDHKSLQYFSSQPHLNPRQTRWMEVLQEYIYWIVFMP